jgi:predicted LPLAT superfamily acyltransferase
MEELPNNPAGVLAALRVMNVSFRGYLRSLFIKKRKPVKHVFLIMVAEERRAPKQYHHFQCSISRRILFVISKYAIYCRI